eukprot:SAG11_NODE_136_length_15118_cov_14.188495_3_plen_97_part_00
MVLVTFYHSVFAQWCHVSRLRARIGRINFSKFLYVRILPEYRYGIAHAIGYTVSVLRSRKTYSRYMKKFARPKIRQYCAYLNLDTPVWILLIQKNY